MGPTVPARFRCSQHDVDLTRQVLAALEDEGLRIPSSGMRVRRSSGPQPFRIDVECPEGDGHTEVFHGTYRAGT